MLILAPGPDFLFVLTQAISRGVKPGVASAIGIGLGNLSHTLLAALGISVIFKNFTDRFYLAQIYRCRLSVFPGLANYSATP